MDKAQRSTLKQGVGASARIDKIPYIYTIGEMGSILTCHDEDEDMIWSV